MAIDRKSGIESVRALTMLGRVADRVHGLARRGRLSPADLESAVWLERVLAGRRASGLCAGGERTKHEQLCRSGHSNAARLAAEGQCLRRWQSALYSAAIDGDAVVAVVIAGMAPSRIDRARRRRNGWCCDQVVRGLKLLTAVRQRRTELTQRDK